MNNDDVLDMVHKEQEELLEKEFNGFTFDSPEGVAQMVGAYKAFGVSTALHKFMQAKILVYMKDGKKYKLAGFNTFDEFCKYMGISRRYAYNLIKHVIDFGMDAYKALININMREKDLNLLKQAGATITEEKGIQVINVADVSVPIGPESKDELSEIISGIVKEKNKAQKELKQAEREIEKKDQQITYAKEEVAEILKPFSGDREDFQSSLEQIQRDFDVICTKMHMHWNKSDNDRVRESMVTSTTFWMNERMNELINAFVRNVDEL